MFIPRECIFPIRECLFPANNGSVLISVFVSVRERERERESWQKHNATMLHKYLHVPTSYYTAVSRGVILTIIAAAPSFWQSQNTSAFY
jgi:hypothetical protein